MDTLDFRNSPSPMYAGFDPGHYDSAPGWPPVGSLFWETENIYGSAYPDTLAGGDECNRLFGLGGDDYLYGRGGADYLDGGDGFDTLSGGSSWDGFMDECWNGEAWGYCDVIGP